MHAICRWMNCCALLQVKLATRFGSAEQKEQSITLRLKGRQETVFVGAFAVK